MIHIANDIMLEMVSQSSLSEAYTMMHSVNSDHEVSITYAHTLPTHYLRIYAENMKIHIHIFCLLPLPLKALENDSSVDCHGAAIPFVENIVQ